MANLVFSNPLINGTLASAFQEVSRGAGYDDVAVLALIAFAGGGWLTRGKLWDKPDPYHHVWFERPQESTRNGGNIQKETRNIAQKLEETRRDLAVFFGTQSGTAEGFANRLARDCHRRFRLEALVADLSDYDPDTIALIPHTKVVVFIMSTYGEGDPTDNSAEFWTWLRDASGTSLKSLRYMAFGLGNSNYKCYNKVVDVVVKSLDTMGAQSLLPVGKADDANAATEEDFLDWKEKVFGVFRTTLGLEERQPEYEPTLQVIEDDSMTVIDLHLGKPMPQKIARKTAATSSAIAALPIKRSRELFIGSTRSCIHLEFDLSAHPEIKYRTGDHLAVWPINPDAEVNLLLQVLGLDAKKEVPLSILALDPANTKVKVPTPTNALALFQHYLEVCAPVSRETVQALAQFAPTPQTKDALNAMSIGKEVYAAFLASIHMTLARLLSYCGGDWSSLPLSFVIETLCPLAPRYYSISSSSVISPRTASLTAVVASQPLVGNPSDTIPGLATSYLSALTLTCSPKPHLTYPFIESGTKLHAQVRKSTFKLPTNSATPIVMVAAGTGLASFRAFLQERARLRQMDRTVGPLVLFFGCRNPEEDYLYQSEVEELQQGTLKDQLSVITAYSRVPGQKKTYVQDRVEENAEKVCDMVLKDDAYFYICGSANMARAVTKRLGECLKRRNGWMDEDLKNWSERQKRVHRWQEDVWG